MCHKNFQTHSTRSSFVITKHLSLFISLLVSEVLLANCLLKNSTLYKLVSYLYTMNDGITLIVRLRHLRLKDRLHLL